MSDILMVIGFSLIGGVVSLLGGICLLASRRRQKLAEYATAFAAGALLSAAFIDILPEALETGEPETISVLVLAGILMFFLIEGLAHWFHHHKHHDDCQATKSNGDHAKKPASAIVPLVVIGDTVHNAIDGVAIAAGFLVDPLTGIIVTLAVAAHEIPQEIGDFGLLLHGGLSRARVLLVNALSALATTVTATIFFLVGEQVDVPIAPILALIVGFFIYIAVSDIIPGIHHEKTRRRVTIQSAILLLGVAVVGLAIVGLHGFIE